MGRGARADEQLRRESVIFRAERAPWDGAGGATLIYRALADGLVEKLSLSAKWVCNDGCRELLLLETSASRPDRRMPGLIAQSGKAFRSRVPHEFVGGDE
jgi:hypothetical protein